MRQQVGWVLAGHTALDRFRQARIHGVAKYEFIIPLIAALEGDWNQTRSRFLKHWVLWRDVFRDLRDVVRRYPSESGPMALCQTGVLAQLSATERAHISTVGSRMYLEAADHAMQCEILTARVALSAERCAASDARQEECDQGEWATLVDEIRDIHVDVDRLPYGIWVP